MILKTELLLVGSLTPHQHNVGQ